MTHVVHPFAHRLGTLRTWKSRWFADKNYAVNLKADVLIREFLTKKLRSSYVSSIEMERNQKEFKIMIHTSRPGMIIGRGGDGIDKLKKDMVKEAKLKKIHLPVDFKLDIVEVQEPEADANIVAQMVMEGIEKRLPFRRVMKTTVEKAMASPSVKGVRIGLSGRLGGAEMARREEVKRGNIPLQTIRADIDFAKARANMTYGVIGIKVWIYRGMKFDTGANPNNN